jgi:serine/threonine protein kinase
MQPEPISKQSLFDDDDTNILFTFQSPDQKHHKDLQLPATLKEQLSVKSSAPDSERTTAHFGLHNKLLVQYKDETNQEPEILLDLIHSRYKTIKPDETNTEYGFSFIKNNVTFDFFCPDKQTADNWADALKKVCVLVSFHDDYKAIKMIGRGSFAKVYLVESKTNGKSFAVKAFTKESMAVSNKANAKPSMLNEIEIMRNLDHENIIKLYEVYETDKSIYLVLELIQGKSLYEVLKKTNFKEDPTSTRVINLIRSLLDALAYLASKGIMHRDLKPDNILLDQGDKVKIVDFGLATFIDATPYIFKKCGTPGYIAPEVFKYDDKDFNTSYDDHCDVFSIGCLLYYMLFSQPLFEGSTAQDILRANRKFTGDYHTMNTIRLEYKDSTSKISKDGLNLLLDLVEFDPKKRITANHALTHPFFIPVPMGMQRVIGSNEFVIDALNKYSQAEIYSPSSPLKLNLAPQHREQVYSPLTPLTPMRMDSFDNSPMLPPSKKDRFVREDSLYLDIGKPEINGRVDTITSGSMNNSLLLATRTDSTNELPSPCLPSKFSTLGTGLVRTNSKTYKSSNNRPSFLKAAIFNNMQRNNSEGLREEDTTPKLAPIGENSLSPTKNFKQESSPEKENEIQQDNENEEIQYNIDKVNMAANGGYQVNKSNQKMRRFQPFAPGNLIIPKNTGM